MGYIFSAILLAIGFLVGRSIWHVSEHDLRMHGWIQKIMRDYWNAQGFFRRGIQFQGWKLPIALIAIGTFVAVEAATYATHLEIAKQALQAFGVPVTTSMEWPLVWADAHRRHTVTFIYTPQHATVALVIFLQLLTAVIIAVSRNRAALLVGAGGFLLLPFSSSLEREFAPTLLFASLVSMAAAVTAAFLVRDALFWTFKRAAITSDWRKLGNSLAMLVCVPALAIAWMVDLITFRPLRAVVRWMQRKIAEAIGKAIQESSEHQKGLLERLFRQGIKEEVPRILPAVLEERLRPLREQMIALHVLVELLREETVGRSVVATEQPPQGEEEDDHLVVFTRRLPPQDLGDEVPVFTIAPVPAPADPEPVPEPSAAATEEPEAAEEEAPPVPPMFSMVLPTLPPSNPAAEVLVEEEGDEGAEGDNPDNAPKREEGGE